MQQRATRERAGSRLADDERAGLRERADHGRVVQRVDEGTPEPVGEPAETPREALAKGVGVQHVALRPGTSVTRDKRALAGTGHAGDQKHHVGGVAEDHDGRVAAGREAAFTCVSTPDQALLHAR